MPRSSEPTPHAAHKVKVSRKSLGQLLGLFVYLRPYRSRLYVGVFLLLLTSAMGTSFPYFAGVLINSKTHHAAEKWAVVIFSILAVQGLLTYFQSLCFTTVGEYGLAGLRQKLFARLTEMSMTFYGQQQVGELISRFSADLTQLQDTFVFSIPQLLRQSIIMLGSVLMLGFISLQLTGVMLACFPPTIIVAILIGRQVGRHSRTTQDALAQATNVVEEALQGIASVKAYANEKYEQNRYQTRLDAFLAAVLQTARARGALIAFIIFGIFSAIVVVLLYGTILLIDGAIQYGQLFSFTIYTIFVGGSLGSFADLYSNLQKSLGATQRVREILEEPTEILEKEGAPLHPPLRGEVTFQDITFAYPARPEQDVLRGLTLSISPGQVVALVGPSGAGKSTLVALLLRFYEPKEGRLLFDGRPATDYSLHELRSQMALVPQEVLLFGGSIAENIAYGKPGASQEEIETAARRANAHEFITDFPEGYRTRVGDRGMKVSGGQRQRLAIARALLKNPAILILDEATSALDAESEQLVQQALEELMRGRTCLVVAHRLSTIRAANQIVVLKEGAVEEIGSHEELMQIPSGAYRRVVELQNGSGAFNLEGVVN